MTRHELAQKIARVYSATMSLAEVAELLAAHDAEVEERVRREGAGDMITIFDRLRALVERWRSPVPAKIPEAIALAATARACADELAAILGMEPKALSLRK